MSLIFVFVDKFWIFEQFDFLKPIFIPHITKNIEKV